MSDTQGKRDFLLDNLAIILKDKGFKKKSFTFKRETEKGLVQIIELGLGRSTSAAFGSVFLEAGIFTEEWGKYLIRLEKNPTLLRIAHCEINISESTSTEEYRQYDLSHDLDDILLDMITALNKKVLPFFEKHKTRKDILNSYLQDERLGFPPRERLSIGVLYFGMKDCESALRILYEEYQKNTNWKFCEDLYFTIKKECASI